MPSSFRKLCGALSGRSEGASERELSKRLASITAVLQQLAAQSAELHTKAASPDEQLSGGGGGFDKHEGSTTAGSSWGGWSGAVDVLALRPDEAAGADDSCTQFLAQRRWTILLHGWLPALRALCLTIEALQTCREQREKEEEEAAAAEAAAGARKKHGGGVERAPADLLSLNTMCLVHAALELIVCWGMAPRLDPRHRLGLSAFRQPAIAPTSQQQQQQ